MPSSRVEGFAKLQLLYSRLGFKASAQLGGLPIEVANRSTRFHSKPAYLNVTNCAQPLIQLPYVLLYVPYVVDLKLQPVEWQPIQGRYWSVVGFTTLLGHPMQPRYWAGVIVATLWTQDEKGQRHMKNQKPQKSQHNCGTFRPVQDEEPIESE